MKYIAESRRSRILVALLVLVCLGMNGVTASVSPIGEKSQVSALANTITGVVFHDYNSNGERDTEIEMAKAVDVGMAGIEVRAFDPSGLEVGSATTSANGSYSLHISGTTETSIRVEFGIPSSLMRYKPSFVSATSTTAAVQNRSGPAVQFVTVGDENVNFAVTVPGEYCQDNPTLVTCAMERGLGTSTNVGAFTVPSVMPDFRYQNVTNQYVTDRPNWPDNLFNPNNTRIGSSDDLGAIFGIGVDRSKNAFFGTYVKRHIEYGDAGNTNTIYRINTNDPLNVTSFVTLPGVLPIHVATPPADGWNTYSGDTSVFRYVGRVGLGDVDVTPDGKTLVAVDMNEDAPKLYFIPINGSGDSVTAGEYSSVHIPKPATHEGIPCLGKWHPMGIGTRGERILIGGVCGAEDSVVAPSTNIVSVNGYPGAQNGTDPTQSTAFVLEYFGSVTGDGSFTTIWADSLGYERGCVYREGTRIPCNGATSTVGSVSTADWGAWNEYPTLRDIDNDSSKGLYASNPQAMLANIEVLDTGGLVLGFRDRFMDQIAPFGSAYTLRYETNPPTSTRGQGGMGGGDILRVCATANGLVTESNGTCPSTDYSGSAVLDISGTREYYGDAFFGWADGTGPLHPEVIGGSLVSMPGYSGVWSTAYDVVSMGTQGIYAFGQPEASSRNLIRPSGSTGYGAQIGGYDFANLNSFNKTNGLADIELMCDQAPVQIGDRLWFDADGDGVQDADELPVVEATVNLYDVDGNLVATTITDAAGEYSFSSSSSNLVIGEAYTVKIDNPADYASGGVLNTYVTTRSDATTSSASDTEDGIDSDATVVGDGSFGVAAFPAIPVPPLEPGGNNHSLDFGFTRPVGVGDVVWIDVNSDGVQNVGEPPLQGAVVELLNPDGTPATDSDGQSVEPQTTGPDGTYFFDNLLPGDYRVKFTPPPSYAFTGQQASGASDNDSDADSDTGITDIFTVAPNATGDTTTDSDLFTVAQLANLTIDAGFVRVVSVGDYVWRDVDRDGVQDIGEPGIASVVLTITNVDGSPVVDVFGNAVTSTTTDENGKYSFDNLRPGQYTVNVVTPPNMSPTVAAVGDGATDSSTSSATSVVLDTAGARDSTLDFGFVDMRVLVGDYVWYDLDRDGVQEVGEPPLSGVVLTITNIDGSPVKDVFGNSITSTTTDANGKYSFDDLPVGQYMVSVVTPAGFEPTVTGKGTSATDSSTGSAMSSVLTIDGQRDETLDFGFWAPPAVVGSLVWHDLNGDGVQDVGEPGIKGVMLSLTTPDGFPVRNLRGEIVQPIRTDANGNYLFSDLPVGVEYKLTITYPAGAKPTVSGAGTQDTDSSTFSVTSRRLTRARPFDMSLDFGVVFEQELSTTSTGTSRRTAPRVTSQYNRVLPNGEAWLNPTQGSSPSTGAKWLLSRTRLWNTKTGTWVTFLQTPDGTWSVVRGEVRFVPVKGFAGKTSIPFQMTDSTGQSVTADLVVESWSELPATGASTNTMLWWALVMLSAGVVLIRQRRRFV